MRESDSFKVISIQHFFDEESLHQDQQIIDVMALSYPGPHLFILTVDPEDTREEKVIAQISKLQVAFGENIRTHLIVMLPDSQTYNSLSHLKNVDIQLLIFTRYLARDCVRWCEGHHSFIYDYKNYSQEVVIRRKAALEKRRSEDHLHQVKADNTQPMSEVYETLLAPGRATPEQHNGNGGHEVPDNLLNIILLGRTGTGKSASANTILAAGTTPLSSCLLFKSEIASLPVTTRCEAKIIGLFGVQVRVIDTPDFFHDRLQNCQAHIEVCRRYCQPGRCVVLLVLQLGRFTKEEEEMLEKLESKLGWKIREYTTILLTHGENLKGSLKQYIQACAPLQNIVGMCGNRHHLFSNPSKDKNQVKKLMKKIHQQWKVFPKFDNQQQEECVIC
ncbi:GTPase IMAP family member 8-like isoform X1 [Xyrichtys novacula]|uniref:GTPase IMAP family member 8-like isoform X1 n=1 Tax=Xyrichtys novacula TaxID=13765 RepID=A0AAV1GAJ0_XYRNO|nr:GTPase IMAP family member 8-like isoform X1 [Xyrichtys novacula]